MLGVSPSGFYAWVRRPAPRQAERNDGPARAHPRGAPRQPADLWRAPHSPGAPGAGHRGRPPSHRPPHAARGDRRLDRAALSLDRHRAGRAAGGARPPAARLHAPRRPISAGSPTSPRSAPARAGCTSPSCSISTPGASSAGPWRRPSTSALAHEALAMALTERRPAPGLLFHSDRGGHYSRSGSSSTLEQHGPHREHQPAGALPRQRRRRELLPHAQDRAGLPAPLSHARGGPPGHLRVHRGLLQPHPAALEPRLPLTRGARSAVCRQRY